ncbi:uncharacterized protein LOC100266244 isoform X2 [Vitis vinifera]|uniref:uncharacterized protein LOC100266244 isoform X2 n=1 Tax=Vitis vinifera TaxID=29760 RepID=UPI00053FB568|nr:uncharacterized protein LOC100266244 isoform X2 [Vitis vinifera]|eukprot:XP_010660945.1 PREDICTED: uncharacterized protein LOC100266244 isoform X2 [Vitis vinifera]
MRNNWVGLFLILVVFGGFSSVSASPPVAKIVSGIVSNVVSALVKWLWSLKSTTNTAISSRSKMNFEDGYTVETVFDGSKLGIEPYSLEVSTSGELLVLDSENSNIYKISSPLSRYSRPKLVAGSPDGYSGHVDGKLREARMNHPKGLTMDERGNIYIADTMNMAIRKISDAGVTTIAGGKWGRGGGHVDGPSEDAKFSNDFDVVYIGSSCSLLVIDRGNQAIREIQLHYEDCAYQYNGSFHLGIAVLVAAGFFGYMLALLQRRVAAMFSSQYDSSTPMKKGSRKKPPHQQIQQQYGQPNVHSNGWPMQESYVIPDEDEPPSIESRAPTPKKTYPFMTPEMEKTHHFRQSRTFYSNGWDGNYQQLQQKQIQQKQQYQQHHQKHYSSNPQTYYEQSCETKNEIVFGAVQEQDGRREAMVIKAVDYGDPVYNHHNIRPRLNYMGYSHAY